LEIVARSGDEPPLLAKVDRFGRVAKAGRGPVADLYEHQARTVAHDEIDLPETTAVVGMDQLKALTGEKVSGEALLVPADRTCTGG
jgi:hypothetical protein